MNDYEQVIEALVAAPEYSNPAIALASEVQRAELAGDTELFQSALRRGEVERAIYESNHEGQAVSNSLLKLGKASPTSSKTVPVGF